MTTEQQPAPDPSRTEKPNWLSLDQALALRTAASRLGEEFKGIYGPGKRYDDWDIADPAGRTLVDVRPIRDEVERRVLTLMSQLGLTPVQTGGRA